MHQHYSLGGEHSESVKHVDGRDFMLNDLMKDQRPHCPCEWMDSEDLLFILIIKKIYIVNYTNFTV